MEDAFEREYIKIADRYYRLRALLRRMIVNTEYCPICRYVLMEGDGPHAPDCEVYKELKSKSHRSHKELKKELGG